MNNDPSVCACQHTNNLTQSTNFQQRWYCNQDHKNCGILHYNKGWQFDNCIFKSQKKTTYTYVTEFTLYAFLVCIEWFLKVSTNLSILGWESRFISWTSLSILALLLLILFIFRAITWFEARWRTCATVSAHCAS